MSEVLVNPYRYAVDGFSPTDISDLYVWYDASDETTITKDVSDRISKWENKEGTTERDLIQDTSDDQPLWISADQNGKDVIDLVDDRYFATASALSAVSQPFTIYNVQEMANTNCHLLDGHGASNRINYPHTYTTDRWRCWVGNGLDTSTISGLTGSVAQTATLANEGTTKLTFRMPFEYTVTAVRASLTTAGTGANLVTVDINESGTTILSTKITIDATETTSTTAATPPVISDSDLANDAEMTVDIDQIDSGGVSAGLKVYIIGYRVAH